MKNNYNCQEHITLLKHQYQLKLQNKSLKLADTDSFLGIYFAKNSEQNSEVLEVEVNDIRNNKNPITKVK